MSTVRVEPNAKGQGAVLLVGEKKIPCTIAEVSKTASRNTCIGPIQTVEHLLAALVMCGELDVRIAVDGSEIPILDGSAAPWVWALLEAGAKMNPRFVDVDEPITVAQGESFAKITPIDGALAPKINVEISFAEKAIGRQEIAFCPLTGDFLGDIALARTFALESEITALQARGLAQGGTLDSALVIGPNGPVNPGGLRIPQEPVKHKLLDALGDFFLLGGLPWAEVTLYKPSHRLLHQLVAQAQSPKRLNYPMSGAMA